MGYHVGIWETYHQTLSSYTSPILFFSKHYNLNFNQKEIKHLEKKGINPDRYSSGFTDFREETFKRYLNSTIKHPLPVPIQPAAYKALYENVFNRTLKGVINNILTDPDAENSGHPQGFSG